MSQELAEIKKPTQLVEAGVSDISQSFLSPQNLVHYMKVADMLSKSTMIPSVYIGKPGNVMIAMEMGSRLGLGIMQSLSSIGVVNGKAVLYGDGFHAVILAHKDFEWIQEKNHPNGAECIIKRKGCDPHRVFFSIDDAKKAGLWGKKGPWTEYPARMLQMRARGFCGRDMFSDALQGMKDEYEVSDYPAQNEEPKLERLREALTARDVTPIETKKEYRPVQSNDTVFVNPNESVGIEEPEKAYEHVTAYYPPKAKKASSPEITVHNTGRDDVPASFEQIDKIDALMKEQEFTPERRKKAFDYFKIQDLPDLTEAQAIVFLMQLEK